MSYHADYPCQECKFIRYDSFHDEHWCSNKACPVNETDPYWDCYDAEQYFIAEE